VAVGIKRQRLLRQYMAEYMAESTETAEIQLKKVLKQLAI